MRAILTLLILATVSLAGCAGDDAGADGAPADPDTGTFTLAAGKGAIAGLLVDDRFRPIDLEDSPEAETQFTGFILLQETGEQTQSNANGEFSFVDLEPGTYTLRVTVDAHEAIPQKVKVSVGEFAEASIVARRTLSEGSFILTQETSMFTECAAETPAVSSAWLPCSADLSLDGARTDFQSNYSSLADQITNIVTEATFNQGGWYDLSVRLLDETSGGLGATYFAECEVSDGQYLKFILVPGETHGCGDRNVPFDLSQEFQTIMFAWSDTHGYANDTYQVVSPVIGCDGVAGGVPDPGLPVGTCRTGLNGAGVKLAVQAKVIQSVFLGEPEVDLESYCVLC